MVRRIGETADEYARRTMRPKKRKESWGQYEDRIARRIAKIEEIHGPDSEKFTINDKGERVLKPLASEEPTDTAPTEISERPEPPTREEKPEGTGQIG